MGTLLLSVHCDTRLSLGDGALKILGCTLPLLKLTHEVERFHTGRSEPGIQRPGDECPLPKAELSLREMPSLTLPQAQSYGLEILPREKDRTKQRSLKPFPSELALFAPKYEEAQT